MYLFLLIAELLFFLQPISNADFIVPVEIDNVIHQVYVLKRPYVDEFLLRMGELYECVLFTASLAKVSCYIFCGKLKNYEIKKQYSNKKNLPYSMPIQWRIF